MENDPESSTATDRESSTVNVNVEMAESTGFTSDITKSPSNMPYLTTAGKSESKSHFHDLAHKVISEADEDSAVELIVDSNKVSTTYLYLILVVFLDLIGPIMLGAVEVKLADVNSDPYSFTTLGPFQYSLARALLASATAAGSIVSSVIFVPWSDKVGRRRVLLIYTYGGGIALLMAGFAGNPKYTGDQAFFWYLAAKFFMGMLGGTVTLARVYCQDIYDVEEAISKSQIMGVMIFIALTVGAFLGGQLTTIGTLFLPVYVAAGISALAGTIVLLKIPEPFKKTEEERQSDVGASDDASPSHHGLQPLPTRKLGLIFTASLFDSLGTAGLQASLSLILVVRFVQYKDPALYANAQTILILFVFAGFATSILSLNRFGAGVNAVIGNGAAAGFQIALVFVTSSATAYLGILYAGLMLSFFSTVAYSPMIIQIVPSHAKGKVAGWFGALSGTSSLVAPLAIAVILGDGREGNIQVALYTTAGFSFVGLFLSLFLVPMFPAIKKLPPKLTQAEQAEFDKDPNWISSEELHQLNRKRLTEGIQRVRLKFGKYADDQNRQPLIRKQAQIDELYSQKVFRGLLRAAGKNNGGVAGETRKKILAELHAQQRKDFEEGKMEEAFNEMGQWFGEYLIHSHYLLEMYNPMTQKAVLMAAFPPIPDVSTTPLKDVFKQMARAKHNVLKMEKRADVFSYV